MAHIFKTTFARIITIIILQIVLFNNIPLFSFSIPFIYVLCILILPFEINKVALLSIAFITGFLIDISFTSYGVHTGATVFAAFIRPFALQLFAPRGGYLVNTKPFMHYYGFSWFFKYAVFIVGFHHFFMYFLYTFSFENFWYFMWHMIVNSLVTLSLIMLSQYFVFRK